MIPYFSKFFSTSLLSILFLIGFNSLPNSVKAQISENEIIPSAKDSTNALFMDGMQDLMLDKNEDAFQKFTIVVQQQPTHATAHYQLSRLWLGKRNLTKAIEEIKLAEKYDAKNKWILDFYANLMNISKDYLKAAEIYKKLAKSENDPEEYLFKEANSYFLAEKYKESLAVLNDIKKQNATFDAELEFQRVQLFYQLKEYDSAIAICNKLKQYDSDKSNYSIMLVSIYFKMKDEEKAFQELSSADKNFPDNSTVQSLLYIYYDKSNPVIANNYLNEVLVERKQPMEDKLGTLIGLAQADLAESKLKVVYSKYLPLLAKQEPIDKSAVLFYGIFLQSQKENDSALVQYKKVLDIDSSNNEAWSRILTLYLNKEATDSLIFYADKGIALFPENPVYNYYKAWAYTLKEDPKELIATLEDGLTKTGPKDSLFMFTFNSMLGDAYQQTKEFDKADSSYQIAYSYDSTDIGLLNNYSYYLSVHNKRLKEAEKMSAYTIMKQPKQASFLDTYGWILYKLRDYKEAKKYIKKAIKYNQDDGSGVMLEHLGDIEYKMGNNKAALKNWEKAKEKGVDTPELLEKINTKQLHD